MSRRGGVVVYIGNLPLDVRESEIEKLFAKYGKLRRLDIKRPPRPPAFCFIEYDHLRQAESAIKSRDRYDFDGERLRVEIAQGGRDRGAPGGGGGMGGGGGYGDRGGGGRGDRDFGSSFRRGPKGTGYRVIVEGLPRSASWQDLKDHVRPIVNPAFTDVVRDRRAREGVVGIVEFHTYDDMRYAIRKLDSSRFENVFDRGYTLRVKEEGDNQSRSPRSGSSRSRSPRRSYSKSYSRSGSRSRSRSRSLSSRSRTRSRTPSDSRSRSRSLSKSRSAPPKSDKSMDDKDRSRSRSISKSKSRSQSRSKSPEEAKVKVDTEANGYKSDGVDGGNSEKSKSASRSASPSRSPSHSE